MIREKEQEQRQLLEKRREKERARQAERSDDLKFHTTLGIDYY